MEVVIGESGETSSLKTEVKNLPYEKITPDLRVRLAVEMVKDAVNTGKLTPDAAQEFAKSLIEDCSVPLTIGTPSVKIFPIEDIVLARPLTTANLKEAARNEAIDYEKATEIRREKAKEVISVLKREYERQNVKYGPFAQYLSSGERSEEMKLQAERMTATKQVLQGGKTDEMKTDDESVLHFIQTDVANVYFGEELQNWLESR